jgi:hypothetical protein
MSENEEPDWLAMPSEAVRRDIELGRLFFRDNEPMIRQVQEVQRLYREHERLIRQIQPVIQAHADLRRQLEPIAQAVAQMTRIGPWLKTGGSLALPLPLRLAAAVDIAIREPVVRHVSSHDTANATDSVVAVSAITGSRSVALPPMRTSGQMTVKERPKGLAARSDGEIVFLVLIWLYALVLPWWATRLPPEYHSMLTDSYATSGLALTITLYVRDKHK